MSKERLVYFDTEFTGLHKNTTLISIGLVSDSDRFYAEFTDYDESQVNDWIRENVIDNLILTDEMDIPNCTTIKGDKSMIMVVLKNWLESLGDNITLVSDVCHYDMMLFADIFGGAFEIPKNVSAVCIDINQEIAKNLGCDAKTAFDTNREELIGTLYQTDKEVQALISDTSKKHNSLYDAEVIKLIHEKLIQLRVDTTYNNSMLTRKDIEEFNNTGLLWLINTTLHLYGWAIVKHPEENYLYPARCKFRGFDLKSNNKGYKKVTNYMISNAKELLEECEV